MRHWWRRKASTINCMLHSLSNQFSQKEKPNENRACTNFHTTFLSEGAPIIWAKVVAKRRRAPKARLCEWARLNEPLDRNEEIMQEILVRAGCFVAVILLGYMLRRIGFFKAEDFKVLSKIVLKITLPAAIVYSFSGKEIDPSMLSTKTSHTDTVCWTLKIQYFSQ